MGIVFIVIGVLGAVWCLIPTVLYGIIGLGNLTGLGVFLSLVLIGIFWRKLIEYIKKLRKKVVGHILVDFILGFLFLFLCLVIYLTALIISGNGKQSGENATVVVLGCQVKSYGPALMLRERLDKAYEYLTENPELKCVLSGGKGAAEPMSEASAMYEYLVALGIDEDRLYIEDRSTDTVENIEYSMELIRREGLSENITIISNEFHLYRAGYIARERGVEYGTVTANTHWWMLMTYYVRELYGVLAECVLGL